jgi:hypothetical protein
VGRAGLLRDVPVLRGHVAAAGRQVPHRQAHDLQLPGRHPLRRHVALPLGCLELHTGEVFFIFICLARPGLAWLGVAWRGLAWPGLAWLSFAINCMARMAPQRLAWLGLTWSGLARLCC